MWLCVRTLGDEMGGCEVEEEEEESMMRRAASSELRGQCARSLSLSPCVVLPSFPLCLKRRIERQQGPLPPLIGRTPSSRA